MRNRNRRIGAAALVLAAVLSLSACGGTNHEKKNAVSPSDRTTESQAPTVEDALLLDEAPTAGQHITFGSYEQDGNAENGAEPIAWRVLSIKDDKALLLADKILDCQPFHHEGFVSVEWETCSLRTWLNTDFYEAAFSADEQAKILDTERDTFSDKVFLLNKPQAKKLFAAKADRKGFPTEYALQQGVLQNENGTCMWWIDSYGNYPYRVDYISRGGGINEYGARAHDDWVGVRPAVRVKWKVSPDA